MIIILIYWTLTMELHEALFTESSQTHKVDVAISIVIIMIKLRLWGKYLAQCHIAIK